MAVERIFHFTGFNAAFDIIKHQNLRLTQFDFLNDPKEAILIQSKFREKIKASSGIDKLLSIMDSASKMVINDSVFTGSFTKELDSIRMWQNYSGDGVALEFKIISTTNSRVKKDSIEYLTDQEIESMVKYYVDELMLTLGKYAVSNNELMGVYYDISKRLYAQNHWIKHIDFIGESEYRITFDNLNVLGPIEGKKELFVQHNGKMVKPYVTCGFKELGIELTNVYVSNFAVNRDETLLKGFNLLLNYLHNTGVINDQLEASIYQSKIR